MQNNRRCCVCILEEERGEEEINPTQSECITLIRGLSQKGHVADVLQERVGLKSSAGDTADNHRRTDTERKRARV